MVAGLVESVLWSRGLSDSGAENGANGGKNEQRQKVLPRKSMATAEAGKLRSQGGNMLGRQVQQNPQRKVTEARARKASKSEALEKHVKTVTMRAESLATTEADFFKTLLDRQEGHAEHLNELAAQLSQQNTAATLHMIEQTHSAEKMEEKKGKRAPSRAHVKHDAGLSHSMPGKSETEARPRIPRTKVEMELKG